MSLSTKVTTNNISISHSSHFYEKMGAQALVRRIARSQDTAPREMSLARFLFLGEFYVD
jgi:hypothetical protein